MELEPVPSRSTSTTSLVSLVARSTRATRWAVLMRSVSQAVGGGDLTQGGEEGLGLGGGAGGHPEPAGDADVADQHVVVQHVLPGRVRVGEPAEQHEVGVAG